MKQTIPRAPSRDTMSIDLSADDGVTWTLDDHKRWYEKKIGVGKCRNCKSQLLHCSNGVAYCPVCGRHIHVASKIDRPPKRPMKRSGKS